MAYTYQHISINQHRFTINEVFKEPSITVSPFENENLSFIQKWLSNEQIFTLQTSGSTGQPKQITLTRDQLRASANRTINKLKLSEKNRAFVCLDTKYIAGKMMLVRALEANMPIVAVEPVADPLKNIEDTAHYFGAFVPLQLDEIFKDQSSIKKLNKFQSILIGGAAVSSSLLEKIKTLSCAVYATYGMTETVSHIALQKLNGNDAQDYFETLPGIKIQADERDCLVIEIPEFKNPIITNDLVQRIDETHFKILGRYDNIINSGGIKLVPETIEIKVGTLLQQDFFVAGVNDERLGQKLVLVVEGEELKDLYSALKHSLPAYEVPKQILYLKEFIRTETRKINRPKTLEKALKSIS